MIERAASFSDLSADRKCNTAEPMFCSSQSAQAQEWGCRAKDPLLLGSVTSSFIAVCHSERFKPAGVDFPSSSSGHLGSLPFSFFSLFEQEKLKSAYGFKEIKQVQKVIK